MKDKTSTGYEYCVCSSSLVWTAPKKEKVTYEMTTRLLVNQLGYFFIWENYGNVIIGALFRKKLCIFPSTSPWRAFHGMKSNFKVRARVWEQRFFCPLTCSSPCFSVPTEARFKSSPHLHFSAVDRSVRSASRHTCMVVNSVVVLSLTHTHVISLRIFSLDFISPRSLRELRNSSCLKYYEYSAGLVTDHSNPSI